MARMNHRISRTRFWLLGGSLLVLLIVLTILLSIYNKKLKEISEQELLQEEEFADLFAVGDLDVIGMTEDASSDLGKDINEVVDEMKEENTNTIEVETKTPKEEVVPKEKVVPKKDVVKPVVAEPIKKELVFQYPVKGEIMKDFSKDTLVFSETLQEWTVHNGIDIKADRTTVVKAAEEGKVIAIKNDPRYGLTVILEHINGFQTVYANLLTTEFVKEGEKVEKGQSLGTVGNSAVFEIADEPHLHFEMLLNNEYVDPKIYLK